MNGFVKFIIWVFVFKILYSIHQAFFHFMQQVESNYEQLGLMYGIMFTLINMLFLIAISFMVTYLAKKTVLDI